MRPTSAVVDADSPELEALRGERDFLLSSLEDLEAERATGELSDTQ